MHDLVAIDLPGGPGFVRALQRAWDNGDAVLPLDQRLSPASKRRVLEHLRPSVVVGPGGESALAGGEPVEEGDALVVATSGTTGVPKGVVLTHAAVAASAQASSKRLEVDPGSHRWLACLPLNHVGGLSVVTRALLTGTPLSVLPGFDAEAVAAAAGPEVLVSLVPTALARLGSARAAPGARGGADRLSAGAESFRTVLLGGSAPPAELAPNVVTTYGMTETGSGVVYNGIPLEGVEVDTSGGEIRLRGPMLLRAYRNGTVPLDRDGWLATGDAGWLDACGRLQVEGRIAEMIVTGGEKVWPTPVEEAIRAHAGVAEVAVAGRPDPEWGQRVVAFVVPAVASEPPSLEELRALVAEAVAPYAAPKDLVLVESLPRTSLGKVVRDLLP